MTKEELEEEAYQYDKEHLRSGKGARWYHNVTIKEAYLAGAKPREERIAELKNENLELKAKIAYITKHLEPQSMSALFEQVEEEVKLEQKIKELEAYNEKLLDGDIEKHNKIVELQAQIEKMKCCEMGRHHKWGSCNYHSLWVNDCKEHGMKLFELKEIKEK